jgi:CheY-like chemotaxis protein
MKPKRILIVDDEERIREVVRACLEDLGGWEVETGASAAEGLEKITVGFFDAIILDISMPDMDGLVFLQTLVETTNIIVPPIVLLTAKMFENDIGQFANLGVVGIINKPFNPISLSAEVATILGW